jgi:endonuclease/exonuclease/phosphatase family metal-dependent hydrolase
MFFLHRTGRKAIPPSVLHAIGTLDIDVLVLTEFVDGDHHRTFKEGLRDIGYEHIAASPKAPHQNQVLIASRSRLADDRLLPVPGYTEAACTNWLHRRIPALGLEIIGLRAPMYLTADERTGYWTQVAEIARLGRRRPLLFVGDFGCDPHTDTRPSADAFRRLQDDGFTLVKAKGDWSYQAKDDGHRTRVDHALADGSVQVRQATYLYRAGHTPLAGTANGHGEPLSDHALLSLRIGRPLVL